MHDRLRLFDCLPEGHIAVPVNDFCAAPLIQPGDIAVIDLASPWLEDGGLYLRRFVHVDHTSFCEIWEAQQVAVKSDGIDMLCWQFLKHKVPKSLVGRGGVVKDFRFLPFADGPYDFTRPGCNKTRTGIIGRVVGLISGLGGHADYCAAQVANSSRTPPLNPSQIQFRGNSVAGPVIAAATHALVPL